MAAPVASAPNRLSVGVRAGGNRERRAAPASDDQGRATIGRGTCRFRLHLPLPRGPPRKRLRHGRGVGYLRLAGARLAEGRREAAGRKMDLSPPERPPPRPSLLEGLFFSVKAARFPMRRLGLITGRIDSDCHVNAENLLPKRCQFVLPCPLLLVPLGGPSAERITPGRLRDEEHSTSEINLAMLLRSCDEQPRVELPMREKQYRPARKLTARG